VGILSKLFGFRWSLYVVRNGNQLVFAMHENAVVRMLGYVMGYFAGGCEPVAPWSLHLNFNHKHRTIQLGSHHFTADGENVTSVLIREIEAIDPGWKVKGGEPVFEEVATKKRLKISDRPAGRIDIQAMLDNVNKPPEVTFFSVMDEVFGKR
jgi:hypothetical protein